MCAFFLALLYSSSRNKCTGSKIFLLVWKAAGLDKHWLVWSPLSSTVISTLISITLIMMIIPSSSMISSLLMIRRPHALSLWILAAPGTQPSAHGGRTAATIFTKIYLHRQFILLGRLCQKKSSLCSPFHWLIFFTIAYFSWILFTKLGEVRTQNRCVFFTKVGARKVVRFHAWVLSPHQFGLRNVQQRATDQPAENTRVNNQILPIWKLGSCWRIRCWRLTSQ